MRRIWLSLAAFMLFAGSLTAGENAVIEKRENGYAVTSDVYSAFVDNTGSVQSLKIGETEFIAPRAAYTFRGTKMEWRGTACGRYQGGGWPLKLVPLSKITRQEGALLRAEGDRWAVDYKFFTDSIEFTVSGDIEGRPMDGYPQVHFCWCLSENLARACDPELQGELGWPLTRAFEKGKLTVLDKNGAGLTGLPACTLTPREPWSPELPCLLTFPAEGPPGANLTYSLKLFKRADLAHSIKLEIVSPNPDHFFVGTLDAEFPVRISVLYGYRMQGQLRFEGTPFVWQTPVLKASQNVKIEEDPVLMVPLKIATPKPGQYNGVISLVGPAGKIVSKRIGFLTSPEKIPPAAVPADFDEFWDKTLAELDKIPLDLESTLVSAMSTAQGDVFKLKYRSWGGRVAYAWLHVPKADAKVPGHVWCPPVSVYQPGPARPFEGQLKIWVAIHGGDIDQKKPEPDFDYMNGGITSRDNYMLRYSYCCLVRCFDILKAHPKCNGSVNVVGGSQGAGLSLVLGGLRQPSTLKGSAVALCRIDWTILGHTKWGPACPKGEDKEKIAAIVSYYDPARFTHRIHCPSLKYCFGLFDWCAPAEGILSAMNGLPPEIKPSIYADPFGDHFNYDGSRMSKNAPPIEIPHWKGTDAENKVSK